MKRFYIIILFILGLCTTALAESSKQYYEQVALYQNMAKQYEDEERYHEAEIAQLQCMLNDDPHIQQEIKQREQHIRMCRQKYQEYHRKAKLLKLKGDQLAKQGK